VTVIDRLETPRLILRPFREADLDAYAPIVADAETMRYFGDGRPLDRAGAWRQIALLLGHQTLRGYTLWAVEEKATGALVGRVGLWFPEQWPGLEIGWLIARPRWGQGLAREAAAACRRAAFETLKAERVISVIYHENARSIRVAEALGAARDGTATLFGKECLIYRHRLP
jgi:RimJ/RimL family protein N-acetyltransferase